MANPHSAAVGETARSAALLARARNFLAGDAKFELFNHLTLIVGVAVVFFPLYLMLVASTLSSQDIVNPPLPLLPGAQGPDNYKSAWTGAETGLPAWEMMKVSLIVALGVTAGKTVLSLLSAFAAVYFRFPLRGLFFALIFATLMLPVEVRISPTYDTVAAMGLVNSYGGMILPLIASATATFLFRQFFMTVPNEILEASKVDGASPMRFFFSILLPLSRNNIIALCIIQFIYGWNQYLWPLLMKTSDDMTAIVVGVKAMMGTGGSVSNYGAVMATCALALIPPLLVIAILQKRFVEGLVESEK